MKPKSFLIVDGEILSDNRLSATEKLLFAKLLDHIKSREMVNPFHVAEQRTRARAAVQGAVASGILNRPRECSECRARAAPSGPRIEAHHEDYADPLKVRWLCSSCHSKADRERRLREGRHLPASYDFAGFLFVNGGWELPFQYDPPKDGSGDDLVERAIRSFYFAGFDSSARRALDRQAPKIGAVLSCGHRGLVKLELAYIPAYTFCELCTEAARETRWARNERRRLLRRAQS